MNMIKMSAFQSMRYAYGTLHSVGQRDADSFSSLLGAVHETAAMALSALGEPGECCLSDEDKAYLRERYGGELTSVEVVRAVRTVYSMGGMSRFEYCAVWGARLTTEGESGVPAFPELFSDDELERFANAPISGFKTLDDLFAWLDRLRGKDPQWQLLRMGLENS